MLNVDKFFFAALNTDEDVTTAVNGRIFNPARTIEQEEEDAVPYIIIAYESGSASGGTKDDVMASLDAATISVTMCAESRDELATLSESVMKAIEGAFEDDEFYDGHEDWDFYITDCTPSAGAVNFDPLKPCCFQTVTFYCDTTER